MVGMLDYIPFPPNESELKKGLEAPPTSCQGADSTQKNTE